MEDSDMNTGLEKFRELLLTDQDFQEKLKDALLSYNGEKTQEAVFDSILVPLASEYDITASFDEFKTYIEQLANDQELSSDEIAQVSGGGTKTRISEIFDSVAEYSGMLFGGAELQLITGSCWKLGA